MPTQATRRGLVAARLRHAVLRIVSGRPRRVELLLAAVRRVPLRAVRARLCRSLSWPLLDELGSPVVVRNVAGMMAVDTRETVGRVLAASGEWEPHVTDAVRRCLRTGDVCVDVGSHVGYYTLLAARRVGPRGHVYAFEASPMAYAALEANLARNGAAHVTAVDVAAGEGRATLHQAPGAAGTSSLSELMLESPHVGRAEDYVAVEVRVAALDALLPRESLHRVRLIKVDVEGYEVEALRGAEGILAAGAPLAVVVELTPEWSSEPPAPFVDELCRRHGLTPYRLVNEYTLDGYFPVRIEPPAPLAEIPDGRCDLLLVRGARGAR